MTTVLQWALTIVTAAAIFAWLAGALYGWPRRYSIRVSDYITIAAVVVAPSALILNALISS